MSSGIICRTRKDLTKKNIKDKNDKICFKDGEILNGSMTKKKKNINYNIEKK